MLYQLKEEGSDEIVWSATTQNFRDYIEFLRGWYEKGIFNDDYLNVSNPNGNVQSTFLAGNTGPGALTPRRCCMTTSTAFPWPI